MPASISLNSFEYFQNHHFVSQFGPNDNVRSYQTIRLGKLSRFPEKPIDEAVRAASYIGKLLPDPVLCLSGGLDSEAMAIAFLRAKVPFKAAIMVFSENLNQYDVQHAVDFCKENKIEYEQILLDVIQIMNRREYIPLAEKYQTLSSERALFLMFLQKVQGNPVLAGEILRQESPGGKLTLQCPKDRDLCYWRYFADRQIKGIPYFHYYTPELAFSFLAHTSISKAENVAQNWDKKPNEFYKHKLNIYHEGGFDIPNRSGRTQKWHGYEGLKKYYDTLGGDLNYYNKMFREEFLPLPLFDLNQFLLVEETDEIARQLLTNSNAV